MNRSQARSSIYAALSFCFTSPDEEVCSRICEGEWIEPLEEAGNLLAEDSFIRSLRDFTGTVADQEAPCEMGHEYGRLFVIDFPKVLVPLYASAYAGNAMTVFGSTISDLLRLYQDHGFALHKGMLSIPDHITHELEFMGVLTGREAGAVGNKKIILEEVQLDFFSRCLLPWVLTLCRKIAEQAHCPFYRALGNLTHEFMKFEINYLGVQEEGNQVSPVEGDRKG